MAPATKPQRCINQCGYRSFSTIRKVWERDPSPSYRASSPSRCLSESRRRESLSETPFDIPQLLKDVEVEPDNEITESTVLYLAYGSNLCAETFKGARGIKPISQLNVLVPSLELTFDLPGIPYKEPCFANTRYRSLADSTSSKDYHKDRWHKGLVGVVYEVSKADFATIIATEGGGASYQDILVDCHEIPSGIEIVDPHPTSAPFRAHTLFSPFSPPPASGTALKPGDRLQRPDPSYAQASSRYLKLIADGAAEHNLPGEYQVFLSELRPYTITSKRQQIGQAVFMVMWGPIFFGLLALGRILADDKGIVPQWFGRLTGYLFSGIWASYDNGFKWIFGDGERTENQDNDEESSLCSLKREVQLPGEKTPLVTKN